MGRRSAPQLPEVDQEALIRRQTEVNRPGINTPFSNQSWEGNNLNFEFSPFVQDAAERMGQMAGQMNSFDPRRFGDSEMAPYLQQQGDHLQNRKGRAQSLQQPDLEQFSYQGRDPAAMAAEFQQMFERPPEYDPTKYFGWVQDFFGDSLNNDFHRNRVRQSNPDYRPGILGF